VRKIAFVRQESLSIAQFDTEALRKTLADHSLGIRAGEWEAAGQAHAA